MSDPGDAELVVRSYRPVFELERRLYRIDRIRLSPGGVPVRGIAYLLGLVALSALLAAVPLSGWAVRWVPWYVRLLALPGAGAFVLGLARVDGRPCHLALISLAALATGPRQAAAFARLEPAAPTEELCVLVDGSEPRLRRAHYRGPGAVMITAPHVRVEPPGRAIARARMSVLPAPEHARARERASVIVVPEGAVLEIRDRPPRRSR